MSETETTTTLAHEFKRVYGDMITQLWNDQVMTYNLFQKTSRKHEIRPAGSGYFYPISTKPKGGYGARGEEQLLPAALAGAGTQGTITPKAVYGVVRLTGLAIEASRGAQAAFVNAQSDAVKQVYQNLVVDMNRMCWADSFGLIGTTSAAATPSTSAAWTAVFDNDRGTRYMREGMIVDFYQSTAIDVSTVTSRIHSIDPITKTVTFEANAGLYQSKHPLTAARSYTLSGASIASGSFMVPYGARAATHATTNTAYEIMGLDGMYDDGTLLGTFQGVSLTTYPQYKANLMADSSANRELSEDLMLAACDLTLARCGMPVKLMRMGLGQRRKYFGLFAPDRRFAPGEIRGGYEYLKFSQNAAIDIVVDPVTQPNRIYCEADNIIKRYELTPIGWGGFDPNKMHWREGYDEATMYLRTYTELGAENRRALTLIDDLVEPENAAW